ncbi:hypothetical protein ACFL4W_00675 [Planctomycetota bacterium]
MRAFLLIIPIFLGVAFSEHFLWEYSGKKLETLFGGGIVNDQIAKKVRDDMSTGEMESFIRDMAEDPRLAILCYKEMAEKEINLASVCRKLKRLARERMHLERAAGYYWTILESFQDGYDIIEISKKLFNVIDARSTYQLKRLAGILENLVAGRRDPLHHRSLLVFLADLNHRLGNFQKERSYLEKLIYEEDCADYDFFIKLLKVYLELKEFDLAEAIYRQQLLEAFDSDLAVYDALLDLVGVFFRHGLKDQAIEVAGVLYEKAELDEERVQVASQMLRHLVRLSPSEAAEAVPVYRRDLTDPDWIAAFEGELWALKLADTTGQNHYYVDRIKKGSVKIDGLLTESCWDDNFVTDYVTEKGPPLDDEPVKTWIKHDGERLYFAYHCVDPDIENLEVAATAEGTIWQNDAIEIFLDPDRSYRYYYQICIDVKERVFDGYKQDLSWVCPSLERKVVINRKEGFWTMEIAMNFRDLAPGLKVRGSVWIGNVCKDGLYPLERGVPFEERRQNYYAAYWSDCRGDNHQPEFFGYFVMK